MAAPLNIISLHYIIKQQCLGKIRHMSFKNPKRICYYSISLKLMVPFLQCKLINDREERMKEESKQEEAGEMQERKSKTRKLLSTKEVTDVLNRKPALASRGFTHARTHMHALSVLPLRFNTGADASQ